MKFVLKFVLILLLSAHLCTPKKINGGLKNKSVDTPMMDFFAQLFLESDVDSIITVAFLAVVLVIFLLSFYIFLNTWGDHLPNDLDLSEEEMNLLREEEERKEDAFLQSFPYIIGIVLVCIAAKELILISFCELSQFTELPSNYSLRVYGFSILLNCVPVNVYLLYKIFPSIAYGLQSRIFYIFLGALSCLTLLTTVHGAAKASWPDGIYDGVIAMIDEQVDEFFF